MSIRKNSIWSVLSVLLPTLLAIPCLGLLARKLEMEQFGLFTLFFAFIGFSSLLDLGFSRAVVRFTSLHRSDIKSINYTMNTALIFTFIIGVLAVFLIFIFSEKIIDLLNVSRLFKSEAESSLKLVALIIPILLLTTISLALLEGFEKFKELSVVKIINNSLLSILPVLFCLYNNTLENAILGLLFARLISLFISQRVSFKGTVSFSFKDFSVNKLKELIKFGGWLTVSNLISPIMSYFDRFILSSSLGAVHVGIYSAPSEATSKMLSIPSAISRVFFPKFVISNHKTITELYLKAILIIFVISMLMALPLFIFSGQFITLWLGEGYISSATILRVLLLGFILNALAQVPFSLIQAKGYSRLTAFIHIFEVLPYLLLLYFLISEYGVLGAAIAWSIRVIIDFIILHIVARQVILIRKGVTDV